jgi:hypothetical protein
MVLVEKSLGEPEERSKRTQEEVQRQERGRSEDRDKSEDQSWDGGKEEARRRMTVKATIEVEWVPSIYLAVINK